MPWIRTYKGKKLSEKDFFWRKLKWKTGSILYGIACAGVMTANLFGAIAIPGLFLALPFTFGFVVVTNMILAVKVWEPNENQWLEYEDAGIMSEPISESKY